MFPLEQVEDFETPSRGCRSSPKSIPSELASGALPLAAALSPSSRLLTGASRPSSRRFRHCLTRIPPNDGPRQMGRCRPAVATRPREPLRNRHGELHERGGSCAEPCVLPGQDAYEAFMASPTSSWRNQITIESLEKIREFDPVSHIHLVAPAALLVMPAEHDTLLPIEAVRAAFDRANEPKALSVLPIKHFDVYQSLGFQRRPIPPSIGFGSISE